LRASLIIGPEPSYERGFFHSTKVEGRTKEQSYNRGSPTDGRKRPTGRTPMDEGRKQ